jgi:hypothetical protein
MSLTIEDGTGVANADSFATVAEAQAFATARGLTLPADDADVEPLLVKAADYLLGLEDQFRGTRTKEAQRLPFPRYDVWKPGGWVYDSDEIPDLLKQAQIRLAVDAYTVDLQPTGTGQEVLREKVGPIETQYAQRGTATITPEFNAAMSLLAPLLKPAGLIPVFRA